MLKEYFKKECRGLSVQMDIVIFEEINQLELQSTSHKGFTFGYLWITHFLWRHCKHLERDYTTKDIKMMLGRSAIDKNIDYIIKRDGVLDKKGYTQYTTDYPISADIDEDGHLQFTMLSELDGEQQKEIKSFKARGYNVKKPLKGYKRYNKNGLFFSKDDTFGLTVEEYVRCMQIDVDAFYIYSWIKMKQKMMADNKVGIRIKDFKAFCGFGEDKIRELLKQLELHQLIEVTRKTTKIEGNILTFNDYQIVK